MTYAGIFRRYALVALTYELFKMFYYYLKTI
jgi:hypothetical protein